MNINALTEKEAKLVRLTQPKIKEAIGGLIRAGFKRDEEKIIVAKKKLRKVIRPSVISGLTLGVKWLKSN
jgi:hypothetical protein|tara:strand:+ start:1641 stop:1850 length:210 start_codon:yes stop_codon:yes gene_type:complete